jgi:hypothetical protein
MNLKELAVDPTIVLHNGRKLSKVSDNNDLSLFLNPHSISVHQDNNGVLIADFAISPSLKLKETEEDLKLITKLIQLFGQKHSIDVKLTSRGHIYFESLHSVYGKEINNPSKHHPIKMTYIRTHLTPKAG